jgi:LPS sulfotransferase NodH
MLGLGYGIELLTEFERNSAPGQHRLRSAFVSEGMSGLARAFAKQSIESGMPCASITLQWSDFDAKSDFEIIDHEDRASRLKALIDGLNPCVIFFLRRRDVLAQAISHFLANESGYFHSTCSEGRRPQRAGVRYNHSEIERYLVYTQRCYAEWINLFAVAGVTPEVLHYEDFVEDQTQSFAGLADRIAGRSFLPEAINTRSLLPEAITAASASYTKVSDEIDNAFRARYLAGEQSGN